MTGIERLRDIAYDGPYSGGMVHISVQRLREICEQIEREVDDISGYESDVLAFVEEKGGLDELKKQFEASDRSYNRKTFYDRLALGWIEEHGGLDAVKERLMPEGMEWLFEVWPKWSNGEYCKFGDWWVSDNYGEPKPKQFRKLSIYTPEQLREWGQDNGDNYGYEWDFVRPSDPKYRPDEVEPPAPKVLDADGEEIRVGDEVYQMGCKYRVSHLHGANGRVRIVYENSGRWVDPKTLTHRAPILASDGRPLREGETVWDVNDKHGYPGTVVDVNLDGLDHVKIDVEEPTPARVSIHPIRLTHERPESWERLEADAGKNPFDYCKDVGHRLDTCENSEAYKSRDLVRRAKALAERGK